ncbi:hypothetical protein LEP1GSC088_0661 [Leptospira interrogans str. L1207]|nr:hypothetical protein LEP1GSC088_0661 [Leptospira interrogans str. L1207]
MGYIQGKNLEIVTELENTNRAFPEITYYQEGCYHCIHLFFGGSTRIFSQKTGS